MNGNGKYQQVKDIDSIHKYTGSDVSKCSVLAVTIQSTAFKKLLNELYPVCEMSTTLAAGILSFTGLLGLPM